MEPLRGCVACGERRRARYPARRGRRRGATERARGPDGTPPAAPLPKRARRPRQGGEGCGVGGGGEAPWEPAKGGAGNPWAGASGSFAVAGCGPTATR